MITRLRALFGGGQEVTTVGPLDLNEAAREVLMMSASELQKKPRDCCDRNWPTDLPLVTGDRVQLQQVILNLMLNASDAMSGVEDRPKQLLIRTEPDGSDQVRVTIRDTGVGFASQNMDRLFTAFYTTKSTGMGMGLSVCRSIVAWHQGRLWAAVNDGPGATFAFAIPRRAADAARAGNSSV